MPRTTLDIDATVLTELKRRGRRERKSAGQVASELLARALADADQTPSQPFRWISKDMGTPRVDIDDNGALWEFLDAESIADLGDE